MCVCSSLQLEGHTLWGWQSSPGYCFSATAQQGQPRQAHSHLGGRVPSSGFGCLLQWCRTCQECLYKHKLLVSAARTLMQVGGKRAATVAGIVAMACNGAVAVAAGCGPVADLSAKSCWWNQSPPQHDPSDLEPEPERLPLQTKCQVAVPLFFSSTMCP